MMSQCVLSNVQTIKNGLGFVTHYRQVLNTPVFHTTALHAYIAASVDACKDAGESAAFVSMYKSLFACGLAATTTFEERQIVVGDITLQVDFCGQVAGFLECVRQQSLHKSVSQMLLSTWEQLVIKGALSSAISRETLSANDVLTFLLTLRRHA